MMDKESNDSLSIYSLLSLPTIMIPRKENEMVGDGMIKEREEGSDPMEIHESFPITSSFSSMICLYLFPFLHYLIQAFGV